MTTLYRVREVSDLFVDACVRHPRTCELLHLSIFGRDGALLEFFASFSLPKEQGGLTEFTLLDQDGAPNSVYVTNPARLDKLTGKLPKGNLFGNLGHAWLYDRELIRPDRANRTAWGLYPTRHSDGRVIDDHLTVDRLWQQIRDLSPVPLADEWREPVLDLARERKFLTWLDEPGSLHPPLGALMACRIELGASFIDEISAAVRGGTLRIPGSSDRQVPAAVSVKRDAEVAEPGGVKSARKLPLELGRVVVTSGVDADVAPQFVMQCIRRHRMGDWGCVQADSKRLNDQAVRSGEDRILSAFAIDPSLPSAGHGDNTLWVITEWDRSVTTVLFPSEY